VATPGRQNDQVALYWLPLGAGGRVVPVCGRLYERVIALHERRAPADLYHAGLLVRLGSTTYAVEMGPVWNVRVPDRGVVREGPVGAASLGRLRLFRYEVRCWPGGMIPDLDEAVGSPVVVTEDPERSRAVLDVLPQVPALIWGRDQIAAGEMWNSNSLVAWALVRGGCDLHDIAPPPGGRAPGWAAGRILAARQSGA